MIKKCCTNNYNEFVTQINQQQQCEREGDRQGNATISNVYIIYKQQWSRYRVFEKARKLKLNYKKARQNKWRVVVIQSVLCEVACEKNSSGLKICAIQI